MQAFSDKTNRELSQQTWKNWMKKKKSHLLSPFVWSLLNKHHDLKINLYLCYHRQKYTTPQGRCSLLLHSWSLFYSGLITEAFISQQLEQHDLKQLNHRFIEMSNPLFTAGRSVCGSLLLLIHSAIHLSIYPSVHPPSPPLYSHLSLFRLNCGWMMYQTGWWMKGTCSRLLCIALHLTRTRVRTHTHAHTQTCTTNRAAEWSTRGDQRVLNPPLKTHGYPSAHSPCSELFIH